MANPQLDNGYLKISNAIVDALINYRLPGEQVQCLLFIMRKTYGWNKKEDKISFSQFSEATGISRRNVIRAIQELESKNIISVKKDTRKPSIYCFNKDFDNWLPSVKKDTGVKKDTKEVSKKTPVDSVKKDTHKRQYKKHYTKDTIPYQEIQDLYHEILPEFPRIMKLTDKRKRQIKARWTSGIVNKTYGLPINSLEYWKGFFKYIRSSKFLMGGGDRGWKPNLEWLTNETNFINIIEGSKYF